jgi:hypothetical protein
VLLAALFSSCAVRPIVQFDVQLTSGFEKSRKTVSVFGVFKDGRLNSRYWDLLAPQLSAALGWAPCEALYGARLSSEEPKLFSKIEEEAKEDGVTPELLLQAAPRAKGDLIMAVNVFGKPLEHGSYAPSSGQQAPPRVGSARPWGRGRGGKARRQAAREPATDSAFHMSVELVSIESREVVATVDMSYPGSSLREAIGKFSERLRTAIPASTCTGWKWRE